MFHQVMRSPISALLDLSFAETEILCTDGQWRLRVPGAALPPMADRMGLFDQQPSTTLTFHAYLNRWIAASTNSFAGKEIVLYLIVEHNNFSFIKVNSSC
jgi:hypothetical protein